MIENSIHIHPPQWRNPESINIYFTNSVTSMSKYLQKYLLPHKYYSKRSCTLITWKNRHHMEYIKSWNEQDLAEWILVQSNNSELLQFIYCVYRETTLDGVQKL